VSDELVFELAEWSDEFRTAVTKVLTDRNVAHEWEGTDLVVDEEDGDLVDAILDEVEATPLDEVIELDDADVAPAADNEATYEEVSALFVAADRLLHAPDDPEVGAEYDDAAAAIAGTAAPYGVGDREWARVLAATTAVTEAFDADVEAITQAARTLRDLLRPYV
jgi:hypothetical protein